MNSLAFDTSIADQHFSTSGGGVLQHVKALVIRVGGALGTRGTAAAEYVMDAEWASAEQTNSGLVLTETVNSPAAAISELRRRTGLTWDQLARLFGVARRSVHFWMSGKPLNAGNEERLSGLLLAIRHVDRGGAAETRAALMSALPDGAVPFDLLAAGEYEEVKRRLGEGRGHRTVRYSQAAARVGSSPGYPSPVSLVGALQDPVHRDAGGARAARVARAKKRP